MKHLRFPAFALLTAMISLLLLFLFLPTRTYSPTEKRYLAETPEVNRETLLGGELSEEIENYLSDHFPGRNLFVGINAYWNLFTGRNAAGSVYYSKDGYLIRAPESCSTAQFVENLSRFEDFAVSAGLPATLLAVPTAGDVLTDKLPAQHAPYRYEECLALAQETCPTMTVPDLRVPLLTAANKTQVYYKTDHHLTSAGCYAVYRELCRLRGQTPLPVSAYTVNRYDGFHGTTWASSGYWLTPADTLETWDSGAALSVTIQETGSESVTADSVFFTKNLASDDLYTVFLDGNHALVRITNPRVQSGTLLILRDSYAHCMAPFFAEDFRDILLVDLRYYRRPVSELLKEYQVTELAFLYGVDNLLTDTNSAWLF